MQRPQLILITGGTRSGKSRFAVALAKRFGPRIVYLATCTADDPEMRRRILRHQRQRPSCWRTLEHPENPPQAIAKLDGKIDGMVIDCLTLYVSGLLMRNNPDAIIQKNVQRLCRAAGNAAYPVVMVTNEVGLGIVPDNTLARRFRDLAGLTNQTAAKHADCVILMTAGLPFVIKGHLPQNHAASNRA